MRQFLFVFTLLTLAILFSTFSSLAQSLPDGEKLYKPCAVCHLQNGNGVPASFPALNKGIDELALSPQGRDYLVAVIKYGVAGPIRTASGDYAGYMPKQPAGRKPENIAAILNHILSKFFPHSNARAFTTAEVEAITTALEKLKTTDIRKLRPDTTSQNK